MQKNSSSLLSRSDEALRGIASEVTVVNCLCSLLFSFAPLFCGIGRNVTKFLMVVCVYGAITDRNKEFVL